MNISGKNDVFLLAQYKFEAPDLWWTLGDVKSLRVGDPEYGENIPVAQQIVFPAEFEVELEVLDDDELLDWTTELRSVTKWRTLLTVTRRVELSAEQTEIVLKLRDCPSMESLDSYKLLDAQVPGMTNIYSFVWMTREFLLEMRKQQTELDHFAFKILNRLFWRLGIHCGPSSLESAFDLLKYSFDRKRFEELPIRSDLKAEMLPKRDVTGENKKLQTAANFLGADTEAPIHHVLFREAWKCQEAEKRVSIVMATAAAEAAVKNLVSALMPDTNWLLENIQSPPLVKMVTNLIPKLQGKRNFNGLVLSPPKHVIKHLEAIVLCRNKIAHGSPPQLPADKELETWLVGVRDLLWLTDYYNGQEWALEHISQASIEDLKRRTPK